MNGKRITQNNDILIHLFQPGKSIYFKRQILICVLRTGVYRETKWMKNYVPLGKLD